MALSAAPQDRAKARVAVLPIGDRDARRVGEFLHGNLNERVQSAVWERAIDTPWSVERPNLGFMMLDGDTVVGAQLAFYSERVINGRSERLCNLGAWCVLPEYRVQGIRLLKALLAQRDYHFTDLSPSGNVVGINTRLGFRFLDTATTVIPTLPWAPRRTGAKVSADPALLERTLEGPELQRYRDHAGALAAHHLLLTRGHESCYVIFRKDRRKGLPLFASILYVSNPELFRAMTGPLARHLVVHHRIAAMLVERAVVDHRPRISRTVDSPRRKMFRSPTLNPAQIDYLYSELVCVPW